MKKRKSKDVLQKSELDSIASNYNNYIVSSLTDRWENIVSKYRKKGIEISETIDFPTTEIDTERVNDFIDSCKSVEGKILKLESEYDSLLDKEAKTKKDLENLILNGTFLEEVIKDLVAAIRKNVEDVASPLSGEIFELKKGLNTFTTSFKDWKSELTDPNSQNNYTNVISSFNEQTEKFNNLGIKLEADFIEIRGAFDLITEMFNKISEYSVKIENIASDIKTLSINASIEAARAGIHGKGFKVIATGTQELSEQTNSLLINITNIIKETKDIIGKTQNTLKIENENVLENIKFQKGGFEVFHDILEEFYKRFNIVFNDISSGTEETFTHINKIMPTVQLHDGIEQQLGNISKIIDLERSITLDHVLNVVNSSDNGELQDIRNNILDKFEKQVTTDLEVEVLASIVKKYGLTRSNKIEIVEDDIELF